MKKLAGSGTLVSKSKLIRNRGVDGGYVGNGHKINVYLGGKKIGEAGVTEHTRDGQKIWTITTARVSDNLVGEGYGRYVYGELLKQAVANGVSTLRSSESLSQGSAHAWSELSKKLPVETVGNRQQIHLAGLEIGISHFAALNKIRPKGPLTAK